MHRCLICKNTSQEVYEVLRGGEFEQKLRKYLKTEEKEPQPDSVSKHFLNFGIEYKNFLRKRLGKVSFFV